MAFESPIAWAVTLSLATFVGLGLLLWLDPGSAHQTQETTLTRFEDGKAPHDRTLND